jgi:integrase
MGVYRRPDSPFWWLWLEGTTIRESTRIPVDGGSPYQQKELRRQAQALYAARMVDIARRRHRLPPTLQRRTFAQHRDWYATHVSAQKRGSDREYSMLRQLGAFFDRTALAAIDHTLAREWRTWRLRAVSVSTVRREEALLKHLLTTAVPTYVDHNPLTRFPRLRVPEPDTRVLTLDEERRLLQALRSSDEDRALVLTALDTLLRLSDITRLTRRQDHGDYLFTDSKAGTVKVPVSTRLRAALDALPHDGPRLFPSYVVESRNRVIRMFHAACVRAGIPTGRKTGGISFHSLRHTGASRMLAAGADVKTVMEIGGWRSLRVLERYLHPSDDRKLAAVNAIGAHVTHTRHRIPRHTSRKSTR